MTKFFKIISYLFHPIVIPLLGTLLYYAISPKFSPPEIKQGVIISMSILTIGIPIIFFFLLKSIGWISTTIFINNVSERKLPVLINMILLYIVLYRVIPRSYSIELYYFIVGLLGALLACLVLIYLKFKASMHLMGISGLITFLIGLSFHFEMNITLLIGTLVLLSGLIASARLYLKAHDSSELWMGFCLGIIPQLITFSYWL